MKVRSSRNNHPLLARVCIDTITQKNSLSISSKTRRYRPLAVPGNHSSRWLSLISSLFTLQCSSSAIDLSRVTLLLLHWENRNNQKSTSTNPQYVCKYITCTHAHRFCLLSCYHGWLCTKEERLMTSKMNKCACPLTKQFLLWRTMCQQGNIQGLL